VRELTAYIPASPAPMPRDLRFSQIKYTSARVHWNIGNIPAKDVNHYVLSYTRADGEGNPTVIIVTGE